MLKFTRRERSRGLLVAILAMTFGLGCIAASGLAQDDERRLWDLEFLKKRQQSKTQQSKTQKTPRKQTVYRRATPKPPAAVHQATSEMLGITVWRLRPASAADDKDARLLLLDEDKEGVEWTPERVEAETDFASDERVRLGIESSRDGYLYVIDREQYADGSMSEPYLIFPRLQVYNGNHAVTAGKVIELPAKGAFRLKSPRPDYRGEMLTVIVTSEPLAEITIGARIQKLDAKRVEQWERQWASPIERFEMVDGVGKDYTRTEKEAGAEGRLLTQEDELPQTLYRITPKHGAPLLVSIPLRVGK